jgi:mono/diheme cytochrome c family protein
MKGSDFYQKVLIASGVLVTLFFSIFFYRELFPEYKIYQENYIALEKFRETYTSQSAPEFKVGIKQIVIEREDKGPAVVDRCISCHVALEIPYFSPTKLVRDDHGAPMVDAQGWPIKVPNEEYIWSKLDQKIADLNASGHTSEAAKYEALKTAHVGEHTYDVTKVLKMHPLIGKETRPFEFHPTEEVGCTSCHNGNGRGLVTDKAHGPVFDGQYEKEFRGPEPHFLEVDKKNDPIFSRVFNGMPGNTLLFQTQPIFVGSLIQAKCVQCHQPDKIKAGPSKIVDDLHLLTKNYKRGQELYLSQACYACHRIAGLARGGVGPELTTAGNTYPWFIKESIVWPQADVKNSTMPNFRLDHGEIEDLMSFLLAQKGQTKAISETQYKKDMQTWEGGRKLPWEEPLTSTQIYDLRYAKTVFATQGCAACHRLQGFESDVGFKIEKENPSFDQLYHEQEWFRGLFPEIISGGRYNQEISGSEIVKKIETHQQEIDQRIVGDVREGSIIEEINKNYPEVIDSFYSNFKFASRVHETPEWRDRVHKVLMTYIQVYGLGRLIGPQPNWSGVYYSDEWLMEHFRNPSSHIPRSIMPVMPFDDTKFYALTNLLDHLGVLNRNAVRKIWDLNGFNPAKAFEMHCVQCHGLLGEGNGPVSEWIYPIPKNLRNGEFLRNLTKEKAIYSITHGVRGTPMAPWGEVADHKPEDIAKELDHQPVLTKGEIETLVNWLYSGLPQNEDNSDSKNVLKWKYTPEDVLKDLKKEGGELESTSKSPLLGALKSIKKRVEASFFPLAIINSATPAKVDDLFDITPNPKGGADDYFIKKSYYTQNNINEGQKLFLLNCAACHGTEADGSGARAQTMLEAKPRMLTNLDWISSRDDLRLLSSIKYGVAGTSMTPWGDVTSTLQRLQMVIFIRSLVEERERAKALSTAIYNTFDTTIFTIERAQAELQQKSNLLSAPKQEELKALFEALKESVKSESAIYKNLGLDLNAKISDEEILNNYIELITLNQNRYTSNEGQLSWNQSDESMKKMTFIETELIHLIDQVIENKELERKSIEGKIVSVQQKADLEQNNIKITALKKLKNRVISDRLAALKSIENQREILKKIRAVK